MGIFWMDEVIEAVMGHSLQSMLGWTIIKNGFQCGKKNHPCMTSPYTIEQNQQKMFSFGKYKCINLILNSNEKSQFCCVFRAFLNFHLISLRLSRTIISGHWHLMMICFFSKCVFCCLILCGPSHSYCCMKILITNRGPKMK